MSDDQLVEPVLRLGLVSFSEAALLNELGAFCQCVLPLGDEPSGCAMLTERSPSTRTDPTMTRQIALLRGINVGTHNRIGMSPLRDLLHELGYEQVRTHLQSGNIVFTGATSPEESARTIEAGVTERFGSTVPVLIRTRDELAHIVDGNPLRDIATEPAKLLVLFLSDRPDPETLAAIDPGDFEPDTFAIGDREIHVWCPNGLRATKLSHTFWEKRLGLTATGRNWNTVSTLLTLADT